MLEARDVSARFGRAAALRGASLSARPGELLAIAGPNGAGKSTLLACLSGAMPFEGHASLDGRDPRRLAADAAARLRAVLEQNPTLGAPFTVRTLAGLAIPRDLSPAEADDIVAHALAVTGLTAHADRPATLLSGGERRRAHLARALAQLEAGRRLGGGRWLLLDEPAANLDPAQAASALRAARAAARAGAGVLAVLHELDLAAAFADRVALMSAGRVVALGPPEEALTPGILRRVYGLSMKVARIGGALRVLPDWNDEPAPRGREKGDHECSSP